MLAAWGLSGKAEFLEMRMILSDMVPPPKIKICSLEHILD